MVSLINFLWIIFNLFLEFFLLTSFKLELGKEIKEVSAHLEVNIL